MMFKEITMQEAINRADNPCELIYMLHRVHEDTTVSELSSSVGFVRIIPSGMPAPHEEDESKRPMMSFAEMLGEEAEPVEDVGAEEDIDPGEPGPPSEESEETESFRLGKDSGAAQSRLEPCKDCG